MNVTASPPCSRPLCCPGCRLYVCPNAGGQGCRSTGQAAACRCKSTPPTARPGGSDRLTGVSTLCNPLSLLLSDKGHSQITTCPALIPVCHQFEIVPSPAARHTFTQYVCMWSHRISPGGAGSSCGHTDFRAAAPTEAFSLCAADNARGNMRISIALWETI